MRRREPTGHRSPRTAGPGGLVASVRRGPGVLAALLALGCAGGGAPREPPRPAPAMSVPPAPGQPPPALGPISVADDRNHVAKRADRDDARLDELLGGALRRAEGACRHRPPPQRRECVDAALEANAQKAAEQVRDAFERLEAMNRSCGHLPPAEMDACAARFVPPDVPEADHWATEAVWAHETLVCERPAPAVASACRALAAFSATPGPAPSPTPRAIGAAVAVSYRGHVHHELVMGALERDEESPRLCLAFVTPADERERAELESAIRDLLQGRGPAGNAAYEFARTYAFVPDDCKPAHASPAGAWSTTDGKWQVTRSGTRLAVRARQWGPGHVLMLAELGPGPP